MTEEINDISRKTESRIAAVKALYANEMSGEDNDVEVLISDIVDYYATEEEFMNIKLEKKFLSKLVRGVYEHMEAMDNLIIPKIAESWSYERIGPVLRAILRAAVYELTTLRGIPYKVIISEYVAITRSFFDDKEVGFINGILDKIAHEVRQDDV